MSLKVTYLGTTVLLFDDGIDQVLFDCMVSRPSLVSVGVGKLATNAAVANRVITQFSMDRVRAIFASHSHYDHVLDLPFFANKCNTHVYGSESTLNVARGGGVCPAHLRSYADCDQFHIGAFSIRVIPSLHSPAHWFNNDLGKTIDAPLKQLARKGAYREGGSFDFVITHDNKTCVIRPSCNYIENQLQGIKADVLFQAVAGLAAEPRERRSSFFRETIDTLQPNMVIPIHWDNFFEPLFEPARPLPEKLSDTRGSLRMTAQHCAQTGTSYLMLMPLKTVEL